MSAADFTEKDVDVALGCVVACGGSVPQAVKLLAERELKIDARTLGKWVDEKHVERYAKIAEKYGPQLEESIVRQVRELAVRAAMTQRTALEHLEKGLNRQTVLPGEAAKIARDLSHVVGQNVDKLLTLTGRPTEITEERTAVEILRGPVLRNFVKVVDTTAEEMPAIEPGDEAAA